MAKRKKPSEKRKYARLNLGSKINFSLVEISESEIPSKRFRAIGKNIGVEGILFTADQELKTGTILNLEIFLPERDDPVYIEGEVRWCRKTREAKDDKDSFDIGIKFLTVDKEHVISLIKYVCGNLDDEDHHLVL
jgi:PilZ domain-containing protein